jgi:hypothetical protein
MCIGGLAPKYLAEVMLMVGKMDLIGQAAHWSLVLKIDTTNYVKIDTTNYEKITVQIIFYY